MGITPQWYFMYRGNGYGPFKDLDEAFAKYESKGTEMFPTVNRHDFYRYVALYGEAVVWNKQLLEFKHFPKPFEGRRDPVTACVFSDLMRLYPLGYST